MPKLNETQSEKNKEVANKDLPPVVKDEEQAAFLEQERLKKKVEDK